MCLSVLFDFLVDHPMTSFIGKQTNKQQKHFLPGHRFRPLDKVWFTLEVKRPHGFDYDSDL